MFSLSGMRNTRGESVPRHTFFPVSCAEHVACVRIVQQMAARRPLVGVGEIGCCRVFFYFTSTCGDINRGVSFSSGSVCMVSPIPAGRADRDQEGKGICRSLAYLEKAFRYHPDVYYKLHAIEGV